MAATICYFGSEPTTIVIQGTSDLAGADPVGVPTITPGTYTFAPVAGAACGKYAFHDYPIMVKCISYNGGGTLTVTKWSAASNTKTGNVAVITSADLVQNIYVGAGEYLKFVTAGAANPVVAVTAKQSINEWSS